MYVCRYVHVCMSGWPRLRRGALIGDSSTYVSHRYRSCMLPTSRTACKYVHIYVNGSHKMPYPHGSFSAKEPYNQRLFCSCICEWERSSSPRDVPLLVTAKLTFFLATAFACCRRVA